MALSIQQASILVGRQIGLPSDFGGSVEEINSLDSDTQLNFTAALGAYIRANQDQFSAGQVATANAMPSSFGQLTDSSFSVGDFLTEVESNAYDLVVAPVVDLGKDASTVAKWLPVLAIGIGLYLVFTWTKAKGAAIAA